MKAKLIATAVAVALASGCVATPGTQSEQAADPCNWGCQLVASIVEGMVSATFDATFNTSSSKPEKHRRHQKQETQTSWSNNWAPSPAQLPSVQQPKKAPEPLRLKEKSPQSSTSPSFAVTKLAMAKPTPTVKKSETKTAKG